MKILWLTLDALLPMDSAGRMGVLKRLERVYPYHDVYLFYFYNEDIDKQKTTELEKYCRLVKGYKKNKNKATILLNYLLYPYTVSTRINAELIEDVEQCLKENKIDLINIDFPQMAHSLLYCKNIGDARIVLNQHNIEWQRYDEIAHSSSISYYRKIISFIEARRLKKYEEMLYRKLDFASFSFVTENDLNYFKSWIKKTSASLRVIPGGAEKRHMYSREVNSHNIIFVGVMSNELNPEGAFWFLDEVWPIIKQSVADACFYIIGKDPIEKLRQIKQKDVYVTGYVTDLSYYYQNASMVIIPIFHGGGVKLKLLEAMSYGQIVVSTSMGAKGTEFVHDESILITDDANEFASYCIDIMQNREKYYYLIERAKVVFDKYYTWDGIGEIYNRFLQEVANESKVKD